MTTPRERWQQAFDESRLREADYSTMSGIPLAPVYGPADGSGDYPGEYPYTRGPYASMYRSKLWTMRMFAGFGTAEDTNWRFKEIIKAGGDGLSTAFDMPTLLGLDSDHPMSLGEVGRCGVAIDSLADMEDLYAGIDLGEITTSMTINSPAAVVFAMFVAQAEKSGIHRSRLGGTLENDILKGVLLPGARIDETALMHTFGVSRTPVREAILELAAVGLIEQRAHRGARWCCRW